HGIRVKTDLYNFFSLISAPDKLYRFHPHCIRYKGDAAQRQYRKEIDTKGQITKTICISTPIFKYSVYVASKMKLIKGIGNYRSFT
ncbi:MAG: hypothetical protein VX772_03375, partial [Bacteroidota bacterium]|nr:hypothetical protein [Bacteroidota bacterium]